jgi:hypothetical protein
VAADVRRRMSSPKPAHAHFSLTRERGASQHGDHNHTPRHIGTPRHTHGHTQTDMPGLPPMAQAQQRPDVDLEGGKAATPASAAPTSAAAVAEGGVSAEELGDWKVTLVQDSYSIAFVLALNATPQMYSFLPWRNRKMVPAWGAMATLGFCQIVILGVLIMYPPTAHHSARPPTPVSALFSLTVLQWVAAGTRPHRPRRRSSSTALHPNRCQPRCSTATSPRSTTPSANRSR